MPSPIRPIIAFAPHPWHESAWMNRQHILSRLGSRGWPVVYSDGALDLWNRHRPHWRAATTLGQFESTDGIRVFHAGKFIPIWGLSPRFAALARRYHAHRLCRAVGFERGGIALLFHPDFWPYVEFLNPTHVAFHVYDVYSQMGSWNLARQRNLEALVARADLITVASEAQAQYLPGDGATRARTLHNGVDLELFRDCANLPVPDDLAAIPHPRIGNIGNQNGKIDFPVIEQIALRQPEWNWVNIGNVAEAQILGHPDLGPAYLHCRKLPNVHFLPEKPRAAIPAYSANMDVNTICYRIQDDTWVSAGYPLKLNEYLAAGKPVVAAPQRAVVEHFSDVVAIASTPQEWERYLDLAIGGGGPSPERGRWVAQQNSWERRVDIYETWLREMLAKAPQIQR